MKTIQIVNGFALSTLLSTAAFAQDYTIGFSQVGSEGDRRPAFSRNMQDEAANYGVDLKFANAQGKQEEQLRAVRAFIAQDVDAIIIAPVVVTGWEDVLEEARDTEIPVFLADRDVDVEDNSLYVTRISADFNLERKLAGAWLAEQSLGNCQIVEMQGTTGSSPAIKRKGGFEAVISQFPEMEIVQTKSGDFTTEGGKRVMEAFIKSTDNLDGICAAFAHHDNMQLGAIQAMKEAGLNPGEDILMVSVDYVPAIVGAMESGEANAAVVLRGTLLTGGVGIVAGTLFGGMIMGPISTLIVFDGSLNSAWILISSGVLLFAFIVMHRFLVGSFGLRD